MTVILDYGMGNLRSVQKAVEHLGFKSSIKADLKGATKIFLPGVGAFGAAMHRLAPLADEFRAMADDGVPIMGLCLGQQLLFQSSEEHGEHKGLGIIEGVVKFLKASPGSKVPNIGWSQVEPASGSRMFDGVSQDSQYYFVHSLYTSCKNPADVAATACHTHQFAAAIEHKNVWATQFHPEKSGEAGLLVLRNFLKC